MSLTDIRVVICGRKSKNRHFNSRKKRDNKTHNDPQNTLQEKTIEQQNKPTKNR